MTQSTRFSAFPGRAAALVLGLAIAAPSGGALAQTSIAPVEETSLARDAFATGLLNEQSGALGGDIWRGADPAALDALLDAAPDRFSSPTLGEALRRLLLSPGTTPAGAPASLGGRKLLALAEAGFTEEVRTIASLSSAPSNDPWVGKALAVADLIDRDLEAACRRNAGLSRERDAPFWVKLRVLCYSRAEEYDAAELNLRILREQGALSEADDAFLTAASIPAPLAGTTPVLTALHLAAARQIGSDLSGLGLDRADAGVLRSLAADPDMPATVRLDAAVRAFAMGVLDVPALMAAYEATPPREIDPAAARAALSSARANPLTDVDVYRASRLMAAPEFLRDRGALIAETIRTAPTFERAYTAGRLYADDIKALEGVIVAPSEAGAFALARMSVGDSAGASQWLLAMLGGGLSTLDDETALDFLDLTRLLAALDPSAGAALAAAANADITSPPSANDASGPASDRMQFADIVEAAFYAARESGRGQAGLAALALSGDAFSGDAVADVVRSAAFEVAGLGALGRRVDFETAWRARFQTSDLSADVPASDEPDLAPETPDAGSSTGPTPRLKPKP